MILLGAGSSVPFRIPDMKKFVEMFKEGLWKEEQATELSQLTLQIESALEKSQKLIGTRIRFDLESLMVVLQDLVGAKDTPISAPTFVFMSHLLEQKNMEIGTYNIEDVRKTFGKRAESLLVHLQKFIFGLCMNPIEIGQKDLTGFSFLDLFYGPLFSLLGNGDLRSPTTKWIFTTNWDLCLKQWLEYAQSIEVEDGTILDYQRKPVLSPSQGWNKNTQSKKVVPLHGGWDLIKKRRVVSGGFYEDIFKVTCPETYFKGNPSEMGRAFMIFPLEAVGYEQSVRSPYLDMLNLLKDVLRDDSTIFTIGFSFRDSTIASIFEEVLRERAERGDWQPVGDIQNLKNEDVERIKSMSLKIFLIDSSPQLVIDNLNSQGYTNVGQAIIPIKVSFPDMISYKDRDEIRVKDKVQEAFSIIFNQLHPFGLIMDLNNINNFMAKRYGFSLSQTASNTNRLSVSKN